MKNLNSYKERFYQLMESEMGNVKPLINEENTQPVTTAPNKGQTQKTKTGTSAPPQLTQEQIKARTYVMGKMESLYQSLYQAYKNNYQKENKTQDIPQYNPFRYNKADENNQFIEGGNLTQYNYFKIAYNATYGTLNFLVTFNYNQADKPENIVARFLDSSTNQFVKTPDETFKKFQDDVLKNQKFFKQLPNV